jgi:hypothetical protein
MAFTPVYFLAAGTGPMPRLHVLQSVFVWTNTLQMAQLGVMLTELDMAC